MNISTSLKSTLIAAMIFFCLFSFCYGLETDTHRVINEYVAGGTFNGFSLKSCLQNRAGIQEGTAAVFQAKLITTWLGEGGVKEDIPYWYMPYLRSVNHFHNPLTDQGFSGIWGGGALSGVSSIQWSQAPLGTQTIQVLGSGNYSWHDARNYFYQALTSTDKATKDQNFADTFRGLGQLMHLVEDLSVPEHTRDDGHYISYNYEIWVKENIRRNTDLSQYPPIYFGSSSVGNPNPLAAVPVANLFDTNQYNGTNPNVTLQNNIGLSEYTNANILSPDALFSSDFPYPNWSSIVLYDWTDPSTGKKTTYLKKLGQGETGSGGQIGNGSHVEHLAAGRWGYDLLPPLLQQNGIFLRLDNRCYQDYASKLIPRAVGYSAALLNYFFRGTIDISVPTNGLYSMIDATQEGFTPAFTAIKLKATNTTTTGENMTNGTIQLVVKYKVAHADPFQPGPIEKDADFSYIVVPEKNNVSALYSASPTELNFDLSQNPIPLWATDVYLQVVFKGILGNEENAVAVGFKDISEPTPMDLFSNTDQICISGSWYVAGSQQAIEQVDANHNGVADYPSEADVYGHDLQDIYILFSPYSETTYRIASPTFSDIKVSNLAPANHKRVMYLLSDYQFDDTSHVHWVKRDAPDNWPISDVKYLHINYAIERQVDYSEDSGLCGGNPPCYLDYYPGESTSFPAWQTTNFFTFRGARMWWGSPQIYTNLPPTGSQCSFDLLQ